ncbi:sensor of ECF-type sigma factor [Flavobacterium sp. NG2]|uniref:sensor of ECF-type sigma factor n=1 Tax=Flavobacterium sp. NG2 TaxID=3097547 RepID=UPI002A80DD8E|nr:sensor of ECF-type sigma factor [Flavobacterium sp. NG2]WPR71528.1 sensor of ECF-type sigma factor [Flavobacterium sp. NG2]
MILKKIFLLFLTISFCSYAQDGLKEKKDQIKALKVKFFTSELELSASESEKFWPIYNAYDDKQFEIRHQKVKTYRYQMRDNILSKMSEREASALLSQIESTDEELYQLKKSLIIDLKSILPKVKIIKLKKAEEDFNRKLLQQYKDKQDRK